MLVENFTVSFGFEVPPGEAEVAAARRGAGAGAVSQSGQVLGKRGFQAGTCRPAAFGGALEIAALARRNIGERAPGCAAEHDEISRISQPCSYGRKQEILGLALRADTAERAGFLAVHKRAVELGFGAKDKGGRPENWRPASRQRGNR